MKELLRDSHVSVIHDPDQGIVRMVRTAVPYGTLAEIERSQDQIAGALDSLGREKKALLFDVRLAPPRNDPEFEAVLQRNRPRLMRGFSRVAALTQTVTGQLQIQRHGREGGHPMEVFTSEEEAVAYLEGKIDSRKSPSRRHE